MSTTSSNSSPLSPGAIAGIAVGAAFGVVVMGIALWAGLHQHRRQRRTTAAAATMASATAASGTPPPRGRRVHDVEKGRGGSVGSTAGLVGGGRRGSGNVAAAVVPPTRAVLGVGGRSVGDVGFSAAVGVDPEERQARDERRAERERARSLSAVGRRYTG